MKKFYLLTLALLATVSSLFAQLTTEPKAESTYNAQATEWYRILFIPEAGGDYSVLTATPEDNYPLQINPEIEDLKASGAEHQLWQFVGTETEGYELVSKTGIHAYVDVFGFALNGAKAKTEAQNFLHITNSTKAAYKGMATKQLRIGTLSYYLSPDAPKCAVALEDYLKTSVIFKKVSTAPPAPKSYTLTSKATGYEAENAKITFEGATDGKIEEGEKVVLKISNDSEQYDSPYIKSVKINGKDLGEVARFKETFEKEMRITQDTEVEVEYFKPKKIIISLDGGTAKVEVTNAKAIDELKYLAMEGTEVEIKVTPDKDCELISISPSKKFVIGKKKSTNFVKVLLKKTTAISSLSKAAIHFYPNPATDFVYLQGLNPQTKVELINLRGEIILKAKTDSNGSAKLDLRTLPKAFYLIRSAEVVAKLQVR